ncbi:Transmembrane and coiled-coil domain-containing protein 3 [Varanus komodoensis]|nr:Transmembrane and coiled-coil domain-containing protein 3 [Varanus komodoensis]
MDKGVLASLLCCQLITSAEHEDIVQHAIKLHRGKGAAVTQRKQWLVENCRKLSGLLHQKNVVLNKLKNAIRAVEKDLGLSLEERTFQVHTFEIFQKELNESENSVFQAIHGLQRALQGDYKDVVNMKESSRQRLEALREAAIKEETEYVELLAAEKHQAEALKNMQHQNKSLSILDEILEDVRKAADRLEEEIGEHAFDDNKSVRGVNFEAVLRVEEDEANTKRNISKREVEDDLGLSMLIDSQNNQYILTKPRDSTIPRADHHFIKDIVTIGMLSLPCGWLCTTIGLPTMFGYIICGVLLGPSGLNSIKVETLGEFGVFFTLFLVGLEFSPERLRKVWKISLQGPCYMTLLMIAFGLLWGHFLQIRATQSVFIATCLSLSSTPLVSRFLAGSARGDKEGDIDYSTVLLAMLVMQDVQLGLFIAVMPTLIQAGVGTHSSIIKDIMRILTLTGQILFSLAAVLLICLVLKTYLIGPYYRKLHTESKGNKEILVLGISAFMFLMLMITEVLDVSMELGCFLAGALISSQGHMITEEIMSCIEPIRDFLAIIFFASIGLHVFPTFVIYELTVLLFLTLSVVIMKKNDKNNFYSFLCEPPFRNPEQTESYSNVQNVGETGQILDIAKTCLKEALAVLYHQQLAELDNPLLKRWYEVKHESLCCLRSIDMTVLVLSMILPKTSQYIKWIVSAGLAQVSEFSFVLGSRARRAGIISREVYLLILSVTTLSLLLAPALWRVAIMKYVPRPERRLSC